MKRTGNYQSGGGKRYNNDGQGNNNQGGGGYGGNRNQDREGQSSRQGAGRTYNDNQQQRKDGNFSKPDYSQRSGNPESGQGYYKGNQDGGRPRPQNNDNWEETKGARPQRGPGGGGASGGGFNQRPQMSSNSGYHQSDRPQRQDGGGYQGGGRGGYGGRGGGRGGRGDFKGGQSDRPQRQQMMVQPYKTNLISNQFKLTLGQNLLVYQYVLDIKPDEFWEANKVHAIMRTKRIALEKALGQYVVSGKTIYTVHEIDETLEWSTIYRNETCTIKIDKDMVTTVNLSSDFVNKDNSVSQNLINIIIKQGFRDTSLKQIGRSPRFFDVQNPIDLPRQGLKIWSGFKASAFNSENGITLAIDNIFKFMSTTSCLERMYELKQNSQNSQRWQQQCRAEFAQKSIIADWGHKRTYIVFDVDFEKNPVTHKFMYNDKMTSVAEYFSQVYDKKVTDFNQPLFLVKVTDQDYYLPPEFCMLDGVPDSVRKGAGMRDALAQTRITPTEKMAKIQQMCNTLFDKKSIKDWDLHIEQVPIEMQSHVLGAPQVFENNKVIHIDENILRKLSIQDPVHLKDEQWIMIYQKSARRDNFAIADKIYNDLVKASGQLKIKVEEPYWVEMEDEQDEEELRFRLGEYMMATKDEFKHPTLCLAVLGREQNYKMYKEVFGDYRMPSQVVTTRNGHTFNLSKATNILKQVNSKIGGNLFTMKFPARMDSMRTMLIGIDVCHSGPNSIVGFAASTNPEMSQYYSEYLVQKKGQEIVQTPMKDAIKEAIEVFASKNEREFPTNFVIYRDGLGDAQRDICLAKEIPQFQQAINELYNKAKAKPAIDLIVVNKRITQRFFVKDQNGRLVNPPNGCIIDKGLVESCGDKSEGRAYDFFMTPASANQGCVLPTHFHVSLNESSLTKTDIQQLTYSLCHFYFNWAGPIKVPAPCQYAHKIAEFYMTIGATRKSKKSRPSCGAQAKQMHDACTKQSQMEIQPLNKLLHFL